MAAKKKQLLGPDGQPIQSAVLREEISAPTLGGVRGTMWDHVAPGLTPQKLAHILRAADEGDHRDYLTLAEEMEERELHYTAVLGTRKRAIAGLPVVIEAAGEDRKSQDIANAVRDLCDKPILSDLIDHLTDGIGKGYAVSEILWETSTSDWQPVAFRDRDPRHFMFDRLSRREIRLIEVGVPDGVPLAPFKFVTHVPRLKSGIPIRGGLAKPATWAFIFKSYTLKDWMAFCEVYGMPLRIGRYAASATEEDRRRLLMAVRNIGTDAAAIVPEGMAIEFAEVKGGGGKDPVFHGFATYLDMQLSKLVLGQTMTTDHGSSLAQAKVHEHVRRDILQADAKQIASTIDRDVVRAFVDLNFGRQDKYPKFTLPVPEPEDLKALSENLKNLVGIGVRIPEAEVRDRFGFSDPEDGDIVLGRDGLEEYQHDVVDDDAEDATDPETADPVADDDAAEEDAPKPARNRRARNSRSKRVAKRPRKAANAASKRGRKAKAACAHCGKAHNSAEHDDLDRLTDDTLGDWQEVVDPMLKPLRDLLNRSRDFDAFLKGLPKAIAVMDSDKFVATLATAMAISRGLGDAVNG